MFAHIKRGFTHHVHYPTMRYHHLERKLSVSSYDAATKQTKHQRISEPVLLDIPSARHGVERFTRGMKYSIIIGQLHEPLPDPPDKDHLPVGLLKAIVPSIGMVEFIADNDIIADELTSVYKRWCTAPEAQNHQVPFCKFDGEHFEIIDWVDRDEKYLGKPCFPHPAK